jgi:hypothetical protein
MFGDVLHSFPTPAGIDAASVLRLELDGRMLVLGDHKNSRSVFIDPASGKIVGTLTGSTFAHTQPGARTALARSSASEFAFQSMQGQIVHKTSVSLHDVARRGARVIGRSDAGAALRVLGEGNVGVMHQASLPTGDQAPATFDGRLFYGVTTSLLYAALLATGAVVASRALPAAGNANDGLAHDGTTLWWGASGVDTIYQLSVN